ncbi:Calx-beta domain-containing protein [Thioflexithrix psekupsensis]|nr:Calx-beta domain-containing protein [Thioflexithrix psekupsensis]
MSVLVWLLGWSGAARAACDAGDLTTLEEKLADATCTTVNLTGTITISGDTTINGNNKIISGNNTFRLFRITSGNVTFSDVTLEGGSISGTASHGCSSSPINPNGGAICKTGTGTLIINRSMIRNNTANRGGGIYIDNGTLNINNSVFMENSAGSGGGIYRYGGGTPKPTVNVVGSTITGNSASGTTYYGGGLFSHTGLGFSIKNTIVAGNSGGTTAAKMDCEVFSGATFTSQGYNLVGNGTGCPSTGTGDQTITAANLAANVFSTAPTLTSTPTTPPNPALNAIDSGTNGCGTSPFDKDYLNISRPQGGKCDIGAHELPLPTIVVKKDGNEINTGTTLELETVAIGGSSSVTLMVENTGAADLTFNTISGLPTGFTSTDNLTTVAPNGTLSYTISLNTSTATSYTGGSFSFNTNDNNKSSFSFPLTGNVVASLSPPVAPSTFTATATSPTAIGLTWQDDSDNEANFILTWSPDGTTERSLAANTESDSITGLTCNTSYTFTLLARNAAGSSSSVTASATTQACPPPTAPSDLTVTAQTVNSLTLSWTDNSSDETGFVIERETSTAGVFSEVTTVSTGVVTATDTGLTCNTPYKYRVKAVRGAVSSDYSDVVTGTTSTCPTTVPANPTDLTSSDITANSVKLTWKDNSSDETGFVIERKIGAGSYSELTTTNANATATVTYTDSTLSCATTYTYKIKAVNNQGSSAAYTNEHEVTTLACPTPPSAPSLAVTGAGTTTANLTWTDSDTETSYTVERKTSGSYSTIATLAANVLSTTNTMACNNTYTYRVTAINAGGSTSSNEVNVTAAACVEPPPPPPPPPPAEYTLKVTVTPSAGGRVTGTNINCGSQCSATYTEYTAVEVTAVPNKGYVFDRWQECSTSTNLITSFIMHSDRSCTALFKPEPTADLTTKIIGKGRVQLDPATGKGTCGIDCVSYSQNTAVSLQATADSDSRFSHWSGGCTGTQNPFKLTLKTNQTCTAHFIDLPKYPVTVTIDPSNTGQIDSTPSGINACTDTCTHEFGQNNTVQLRATASTGWIHTHFSGDADCDDGTLTVTQAVNCRAHFAAVGQLQFALTHDAGTEGDRLTITVLRENGSAGEISVGLNIQDLTTQASDYQLTTQRLTWANGDDQPKTFTFLLNEDNEAEAIETVRLELTDLQGGATFGQNQSIEIKIFDLAPFSSLQIATARYTANELDGQLDMIITRAASSRGAVSVDYQTRDGTATAGTDYTAITGTLHWADGDSTHRVVTVPIHMDLEEEPLEDFFFFLQNPQPNNDKLQLGDIVEAQIELINTPVSGAGLLQFTAPVVEAYEGQGMAHLEVARLGGATEAVSVQIAVTSGTATLYQDYTPQLDTLNWPANDTSVRHLPVALFTDDQEEGVETAVFTLQNPTNGALLGSQREISLRILDEYSNPATNADYAVVRFTETNYNADRLQAQAAVVLKREGNAARPVSVRVQTQNGTAIAGKDYTATDTVVTWSENDVGERTVLIPLIPNTTTQRQHFSLRLSEPNDDTRLATPFVANITLIAGTNPVTPPTTEMPSRVQFEADTYRVSEEQGNVTLRVLRLQSDRGVLRVPITIELETANYNDFVNTSTELIWADGEMGAKTLTIGISQDKFAEGKESFLVRLGQPELPNSLLGAIPVARVEIYDQSVVQFDASEYSSDENASAITLNLIRVGSPLTTPKIRYETVNDTATAGRDYENTQGELSWMADEVSRTITIPILDNSIYDGQRRFSVRLTGLNGAAVGVPHVATIHIIDDEQPPCEPPVIDCRYRNVGKILRDARVMPNGVVIGGTMGGTIENFGLIDGSAFGVTFEPNTIIKEDGRLRGTFSGNPHALTATNRPPLLQEVTIETGSYLAHLDIGAGTVLSSAVKLGAGVRFKANGLIPPRIDLSGILGVLGSESIDGMRALNLMTDVLEYNTANGIVGVIQDNLMQKALSQGLTVWPTLTQDPDTGLLTLTDPDGQVRTLLPVSVTQYNIEWCQAANPAQTAQCVRETPLGFREQSDGSLVFVTQTHREVTAKPVMRALRSMRRILAEYDLTQVMWGDGVFYVPIPEQVDFFATQAAKTAELPYPSDSEYGSSQAAAVLNYTTPEVFFISKAANDDVYHRQILYPAAAYPDAIRLYSYQQQAVLHNDGSAVIPLWTEQGVVTYRGVFDYVVLAGQAGLNTGRLTIRPIADQNGDGFGDYEIIYPNDSRQWLFRLP